MEKDRSGPTNVLAKQRSNLHRGVMMRSKPPAYNSRNSWEQEIAGIGVIRDAEKMALCNRLDEKQFNSWICSVISFSQMATHPHA